jgi:hypothetical protein
MLFPVRGQRELGGYCWLEGTTSASLQQTLRPAPRASRLLVRDGGPNGGDSLPSSEAFWARNSREPASSCCCELPRSYFSAAFGLSVTCDFAAEGESRVLRRLTIGWSYPGSNKACLRRRQPVRPLQRRREHSRGSAGTEKRPVRVAAGPHRPPPSTHASPRARRGYTGGPRRLATAVSKARTSPEDSVWPAAELASETSD